jgi:hypothetical protein
MGPQSPFRCGVHLPVWLHLAADERFRQAAWRELQLSADILGARLRPYSVHAGGLRAAIRVANASHTPAGQAFVALGLSVHFQCGLFLRDRLHSDWQIGKAASINMVGPLIVAALAWPMLRERTSLERVIAVLAGFLGVLVIIRPGSEVFQWAALIIVFSALMNGLYQIFTREIADTEAAQTSAIYSSVVGAFGMFLVLPFVWRTPLEHRSSRTILQPGCVGRDEPLLRRTVATVRAGQRRDAIPVRADARLDPDAAARARKALWAGTRARE